MARNAAYQTRYHNKLAIYIVFSFLVVFAVVLIVNCTSLSDKVASLESKKVEYQRLLETEKQEAKVTEEVTAICKEAGIARDSFLRAVGREFDRSKIQRGEDGAISNRDALVEYERKDFADFGSTTVEHGAPPVTPPSGGNKTYTRAEIQAMTPDEINKNWAEVQKSLAALN